MLRAVLVTPLSGPLAGYGRAGAVALQVWADRFAGGVELMAIDAHPDPRAAARRAVRAEPDLLFGPYGSGPAREVAAASARLVWNHGGARVEAAGNVVSVLAPADTYFDGAVRAVHRADPGLPGVSIRYAGSGFPRAVAAGAAASARALGLRVSCTPLPADPTGDSTGDPTGDPTGLLLVAGGFADELAAARRLLPGRWRAAGLVGAGVEEVLADLGPRREGLLGPAQWVPEVAADPDEGPTAAEFAAAYRAVTGVDPPYPAAQAFASGVIALRCLRDAGIGTRPAAGGTDLDAAVLAAARALDCTTLLGRFRLDATGRQVGHRVLTVQWQDGVRRVVWPPERAQAGMRYPLSA